MEKALRHHKDAEFELARGLYTQALAIAPTDVDALHMLGAVEYRLNDLVSAEKHLRRAMQLAPNVPAIIRNLRIAQAACGTTSYRRRIFDPSKDHYPPPSAGGQVIHILQFFRNRAGGSELHTMDLAARLRPHARVKLWTDNPDAEPFFRELGVRLIEPGQGLFPMHGTLVIVGASFPFGNWYGMTSLRRTILHHNIDDPVGFLERLRQLDVPGTPLVELLYVSEAMLRATGLPGLFELSPIDTDLFAPASRLENGRSERPFTVGRLSRAAATKFHPEAPAFYKRLAEDGFRIRLMGATHLASALGDCGGIELLAPRAEPAHEFLRSLDCFTYRTDPSRFEPWGRVVTEAMAVGLPVVVHVNGGYAQIIRHGENGYLFHRDEEALQIIGMLRDSPGLRNRIGRAARETVEAICSEKGFRRFVDFYLR